MLRTPPLAAALVLALVTPAGAQDTLPARPQKASLDSEAPLGAPPHWLPDEPWVQLHWLPYDERRLHRLLGVERGAVWRQLRDDTRNLAQLAERRGWEPAALARELVAPWKGRLREPHRLRVLELRALRTLTQGHLAQHIFFHSLHQEAIPSAAPAIFGVASRAEWAALRRSELSPLQICRLNGLSRGHATTRAEAALHAAARLGVEGQAMPAAQGRRLLARQLRQLPRWLQQTRYNGPPPLKDPRESPSTASNYSNNAALSGDGRRVVYESYQARLTLARARGEIAVMSRAAAAAAPVPASPTGAAPRSSYNPSLSADGRWVVFESADGNLNFAKRYGQMRVLARDLAGGATLEVSHPPGLRVARSAYNPSISGDGRRVAFEAYERPDAPGGATRVLVGDLRGTRVREVPPPGDAAGDVYEPELSGDGRRLAFTALSAGSGASAVFVRDLRRGRTRRASRPGEEAWEPELSADGTTVAFTAARAGGGSRVVVVDLASGRRRVVGDGATAFEPSLSADGRRLAFVSRRAGERATQVYVADVATATTQLASRASGTAGAAAAGSATHPALSADGRRVAFTSDAWNLSAAKCNGARGVFVRDLERGTTTLVSEGDGANRGRGPTKGSGAVLDARVALMCA